MFTLLTCFDRNNKIVFSNQPVQGDVPDESSIFSGHNHAALQSQEFGCVLLFNRGNFRLYQWPCLLGDVNLRGTWLRRKTILFICI